MLVVPCPLDAHQTTLTNHPLPCTTAHNNTASSPCTWPGITCDPVTQRVTRLVIDASTTGGARITGPLAGFTELPALEAILLPNNSIGGTLPAAWGALPRLQEVDLTNNLLTGGLPSGWGSGAAKTMKAIRLSYNFNLQVGCCCCVFGCCCVV